MNIRYLTLLPAFLIIGCSSEYGPSDLEVSDKGAFVEKGTSSRIDGQVVVEKEKGGSLTVEFDDGFPDGDVVMRDADNNVILESSFTPKEDIQSLGRGGGFINEMLSLAGGQLSTRDYLKLFEDFAEYDGDYLRVNNKKKTQGYYSNGQKDERWRVFCENGQLESDVSYKRFEEDDKQVTKKIGKEFSYTCDGDVLLSAERDKKGRLQGEYFEAVDSRYNFSKTESKKPQPRYARNYKDGEFDGLQKEYFNDGVLKIESNYKNGELNGLQKEYYRDGKLKIENNFKLGVKDGVEKTYDTKSNYTTREKAYGLKELKNYSSGQLNGRFARYDINQKEVLSGQYRNDQQVGLWLNVTQGGANKAVTDFDSSNFITDKIKAFKKACYLPSTVSRIRWSNRKNDLTNCEYYVENNIVDINKKISLDIHDDFKRVAKSSKWTYLAVAAQPAVYEVAKKHGLNTKVVDSVGRSRLHICLEVSRPSPSRHASCSTEQAISYINDVDLNAVSNSGTVLHLLASKRVFGTTKPFYVGEDLKMMRAIIDAGANVNQLNHINESALMHALANSEYKLAEMLLDAGASIDVKDDLGRTTIGRLFIDGRGRWKSKKINAEGTRVLAKIIALGGDTTLPVKDGKTVVDFSEEKNTIHHIKTLKEAKSMSLEFTGDWKSKAQENAQPVTQSADIETASDNGQAGVINKAIDKVEPVQASESAAQIDSAVADDSKSIATSALVDGSPKENAKTQEITSGGTSVNNDISAQQQDVAGSDDRATALLREQAGFLVEQANEHIKSSRLKTPKNNSALSSLEQLKKIDPENENIVAIETAIGNKYLSLSSGKINKGDKRGAQSYLNSASEFIQDEAVINQQQQKIDSYVAPVATTTTVQNSGTINTSKLVCEPSAKAAGVPLLGRSFTVKQSLPRTESTILSTAKRVIQRTYNNVRQSGSKITYEQPTKGKPIKFTLTVKRDGNNTLLSIKAKTPPGLVSQKSAYKTEFCAIVAEL